MIFTKGEMLCFNSVLDSQEIPGVALKAPLPSEYDKYIIEVLKSLRKKGLTEDDGKLSKLAALPIMTLEDYKKAKKRLYLNDLRISFNYDKSITLIKKAGEDFELTRLPRECLLLEILKQCEYLKGAQDSDEIREEPETFEFSEWEQTITDVHTENIIAVKSTDGEKEQDVCIYYWVGSNGYEYDLEKKERTRRGPRDMRVAMMERLGINSEGDEKYAW